ncbi:endonuclease MutS2 [Paenibacillus assamensis]|uniref:endonuclease MutS2 n=1 Tax=Paenibacillus assamensis TaxID=311244 RepID=UPI0004278C15|nr:hypothetical protein [Paenibacillus assamensis]
MTSIQERSYTRLGYDQVKENVMEHTLSYIGRRYVEQLSPSTKLLEVEQALDESSEAKALLETRVSIPLATMDGLETILNLVGTGYMFSAQDFSCLGTFLHSCEQLRSYMSSKAAIAPRIHAYVTSMKDTGNLKKEIERCIHHGHVVDAASKELERVRRKIAVTKQKIQSKLDSLVARNRSIMQEGIVSMRNGRYVIPVKRSHRNHMAGVVHDESGSGQTIFIEPKEVAALQSELNMLYAEEACEEGKVLSYLTGLVDEVEEQLKKNAEIIGKCDFIFAKGKYARTFDGNRVQINDQGIIDLREAKHPLIYEKMVALNIAAGSTYRSLIVTGPNTGGKTVTLRTLGLLTLMVQSGLLIPAHPSSRCALFSHVMIVVGDDQSMEQSLSTFSAHMNGIIDMLRVADESTLVLIDEMAAGTDPGEGIALSIAIMEELHRRGAVSLITTHFNELKTFASQTEGFENARMEFDAETLHPLYKLTIGEAGSSYALAIAKRLGIEEHLIERSEQLIHNRYKTR